MFLIHLQTNLLEMPTAWSLGLLYDDSQFEILILFYLHGIVLNLIINNLTIIIPSSKSNTVDGDIEMTSNGS